MSHSPALPHSKNAHPPATAHGTAKRFRRTHLQPVLEIDAIITLHYFEYAKNFCGIEEAHNFWELVYVDAGTIEASADDTRYALAQK